MISQVYILILLATFTNLLVSVQCLPDASELQNQISTKQIHPTAISCTHPTKDIEVICKSLLEKLNTELQDAGIAIDKSTTVIRHDDGNDQTLRSGCSSSAYLEHQHVVATLSAGTTIPIKGDIIVTPVVIDITVPTHVYGRFDLYYRLGFKFFRRCRHYMRDHFSLHADLNTNIRLYGRFYVDINFAESDDGEEYQVILRPMSEVDFSFVGSPSFHWRHTGLNRLVGFIVDLFRSRADTLIRDALRRAMDKNDDRIANQLQEKVDEGIRRIFRTNSDGVRIISVPNSGKFSITDLL